MEEKKKKLLKEEMNGCYIDKEKANALIQRSKSVKIGMRAQVFQAILSLFNFGVVIWMFHLSLTSTIKWWQLLIFIVTTFIMFCSIMVIDEMRLCKAADDMMEEQRKKLTKKSDKPNKSNKND